MDSDNDSLGDACDTCPLDADNDIDGDTVCGDVDNCPDTSNLDQADGDDDGLGDVCDTCTDTDGDGMGDPGYPGNTCPDDNCPATPNPDQTDSDDDDLGDACDICPFDPENDIDGDNVCGDIDNCPTTPNPDQADSNGNGIGDACEAPPAITTAVSRMTHGSAGVFDIDVLAEGAIECRSGGSVELLITFDKLIKGVNGLDPSDVTISQGVLQGLEINGTALSLQFSGVPAGSCPTVSFPGIENHIGSIPPNPCTDTMCFCVLDGDVSGDGGVNVLDLVVIRNELGKPLTSANCRADVSHDGVINVLDLVVTRNVLGQTITGSCP